MNRVPQEFGITGIIPHLKAQLKAYRRRSPMFNASSVAACRTLRSSALFEPQKHFGHFPEGSQFVFGEFTRTGWARSCPLMLSMGAMDRSLAICIHPRITRLNRFEDALDRW